MKSKLLLSLAVSAVTLLSFSIINTAPDKSEKVLNQITPPAAMDEPAGGFVIEDKF